MKSMGSKFDDFLKEERLFEECTNLAIQKINTIKQGQYQMTIKELQAQIKANKAEIKRIKKENRKPFNETKTGRFFYSTISTTMSPFAKLYNNAQSKLSNNKEVGGTDDVLASVDDIDYQAMAEKCLQLELLYDSIPNEFDKNQIKQEIDELKKLIKANTTNPFDAM